MATRTQETSQYGKRLEDLPGATRIGAVWLMVPPINIHYSNTKFEKEMATLRQPSSTYIKSGRGLWQFDMDLVFSGVGMINDKLAKIIGQIRRTPFTMMRNETIQKIISYNPDPNSPNQEIPVAITGYTINTETNLPDTIIMRLSFIVFNYRPFLNSMQFLKQIVNNDGTFAIVPSPLGIKDSNLYKQWCTGNPIDPYIIDGLDLHDFMFAGELQYSGTHTPAQSEKHRLDLHAAHSDDIADPDSMVSRIDVQGNNILRNASRIVKLPASYVNERQTLTLGYHVFDPTDALDLRLGDYLSRNTQKWIGTEPDRRGDVLGFLGMADTGQDLDQVIQDNLQLVSLLPAVNNASDGNTPSTTLNKYVKKFRFRSDSSTNILGIAVRHSIPLSILPIISSPVPTAQYMGGAASTITITIETTSEKFLETINAVDHSIEASARHKRRHSGSEITYVENDVINLNGTFVVNTSDMDIQSVPDNPGCYMITYILREQSEVMNALTAPASEIKTLKKKLIQGLLSSRYAKDWQYKWAYTKNERLNLTGNVEGEFKGGNQNISYLKTVVFPSWVRTIRNGYLQYAKQLQGAWGLAQSVSSIGTSAGAYWAGSLVNPVTGVALALGPLIQEGSFISNTIKGLYSGDPKMNLDRLMFENPVRTEKDIVDIAVLEIVDNSLIGNVKKVFGGGDNAEKILALQNDIFNNRGLAYNQIWRVMTGQSNYPQNDMLYTMLRNYLQIACAEDHGETRPANAQVVQNNMVVGATALLAASDNRRWEAMLRSPFLLAYELRLATNNQASIKDVITKNAHSALIFTAAELANAGPNKDLLATVSQFFDGAFGLSRCYPDLGVPFSYMLEDANGKYITADAPTDLPENVISLTPVNLKNPKIQSIKWGQPSFYLLESGLLPDDQTYVNTSYHYHKDRISKKSRGLESIFGSGVVSSNALSNIGVTNDVTQFKGVASPSDFTGSSMAAAQNIALSDDQKVALKTQDAITKALQDNPNVASSDLAFGKVSAFKTTNDLFMNNSLGSALGHPGTQTSNEIIAEAQYEHKTFKSSLSDLNPDLDHTVAGIITDAQERLLGLPRYYSINKAYPTYKLYFRAEGNPEFLLFDNFYDYRAIESIRYYKDKASPCSVMNIVLNNYNEVLTDYAAVLAKISRNSQDRNTEDRVQSAVNGKPLRSLFLEPGTQIQLKLGYDADPAALTTVFNGFITSVSPGERYEIECQSYGAELFADADMGTFTGWVCPPKQFIWWMLMNPKVKHLGTLFQPTILPQGTHDFLDGFFAFDDNIYINQNLEPGKLRLFQVYNADNMSMWDVLQDIAAAHPGFVCQVVPYDDRETIFFGRPDHFYKYTQDLGVTAPYFAPLVNNRADIINTTIQSTGSGQAAAQTIRNMVNPSAGHNISREWFNYMQWLSINEDIKNAMDSWRTKLETGQAGISNNQFNNLLEYCRWVEILQNLAGDKNTGNIQYDINRTHFPAPTVQDVKNSTKAKSVSPDNPSSTEPTVSDKMSGKSVASAGGAAINYPVVDAGYAAPVSQMSTDIAKVQAQVTNPSGIPALDSAIRSGILASLIGRPIPFNTFVRDKDARLIAMRYSGDILNPDTGELGDKNPFELYQNAQVLLDKYAATNSKAILDLIFPPSGHDIADSASSFYQKFGIFNTIAILAWYRVAAALAAMASEELGGIYKGVNNANMMASNMETVDQFDNVFNDIEAHHAGAVRVAIPGIVIDIVNRNIGAEGKTEVLAPYANEIQFRGNVFSTDLKVHQSLRQLILTSINNVNPAFQELGYFLGKSPITKRFRNYHLKTSYEHICNNEIIVNYMGMWNSIKIKYKRNDLFDYYIPVIPSLIWGDKPHSEFHIQAGDTLYDRIIRETTVTIENARTVGEARAYATSLLAEGIRNMYTGQLTLVGDPEVKPTDVIYIYDDYNSMYGPIEVKSVTHIMDQTAGFITVVEPQAHVEPLGVSIGAAQIIHEIFDTLLIPVMFFAPEIGLAEDAIVGLGGLARVAAAEAPSIVAKDVAEGFMSKTLAQGSKAWNATSKAIQSTTENVFDPIREESFVRGFTKNLNGFTKGLVKNNQLTAAEADNITSDVILAEIKKTQPGVKDLSSASQGDIIQALKNVVNGQSTVLDRFGNPITAGSPLTSEALDKAVSDYGFKTRLLTSQTRAGVAGTAASISAAMQSFKVAAVSRLLGYGLLNTLKLMAVAGPIAYYQMFAGTDDANYACPLRITPLQFNGQPYTAGLDGLTHQSGIWNHMAGQFRRFWGSMRTLGDAIGETVTGIGDVLDR